MKWLIIQSAGEHKGQGPWAKNDHLRECWGLWKGLVSLEQQVTVWGLRHENFEQVPDFESFDVVLLVENYEMGWLPDFGHMARPVRMQWIIDLHCQPFEAYAKYSQHMDYVLHSTKSLVAAYSSHVPRARHIWFPNAIDDRYFSLNFLGVQELFGRPENRHTDLLFIGGRGPTREAVLTRLEKEAGLTYGYGITGTDYISALMRAKIGFNKNMACDLNYRTFEVLGLGACLLTNYDPVLAELGFKDRENCVLYRNDDEAVILAKQLLSDGSWERIGRAGYELSERHTYTQRLKELFLEMSLS